MIYLYNTLLLILKQTHLTIIIYKILIMTMSYYIIYIIFKYLCFYLRKFFDNKERITDQLSSLYIIHYIETCIKILHSIVKNNVTLLCYNNFIVPI